MYSSWRRASVLGGGAVQTSKHVARQQQSCHRNMLCAWTPWKLQQRTTCRWTSGADVYDLPKPSACRQPSTGVPGRTKTSDRNGSLKSTRLCTLWTVDRKPVQLAQNWRDVVPSSSSSKKPSGGILDGLRLWWLVRRHLELSYFEINTVSTFWTCNRPMSLFKAACISTSQSFVLYHI